MCEVLGTTTLCVGSNRASNNNNNKRPHNTNKTNNLNLSEILKIFTKHEFNKIYIQYKHNGKVPFGGDIEI